jgi:hypothetical protein
MGYPRPDPLISHMGHNTSACVTLLNGTQNQKSKFGAPLPGATGKTTLSGFIMLILGVLR